MAGVHYPKYIFPSVLGVMGIAILKMRAINHYYAINASMVLSFRSHNESESGGVGSV